MTSSIHDLIQHMTDNSPVGAQAKQALQSLSVFLTDSFGGTAIERLLPYSREIQVQIVATLQDYTFLHKSEHPGRSDWYERYRPWQTRHRYRLDQAIVEVFQPHPTEEEQRFAAYAASLFRPSKGIPQADLTIYLDLVAWAEQHKPEIAVEFALRVANGYGGVDSRPNEALYRAASVHNCPDQQLKAAQRLGRMLKDQGQIEESALWYERVLALGHPESDSEIAFAHIHAREELGRIAKRLGQWARARTLYETANEQRRRLKPDRDLPLNRLLWLCGVLEKQGDAQARAHYSQQICATWRPTVLRLKREIDGYAAKSNASSKQRQAFARDLNQRENNNDTWRRLVGAGDVLWHWGRFEYANGRREDGVALCRLALVMLESQQDIASGWWRRQEARQISTEIEAQYLQELKQGLLLMMRTKR